MNEKIKKLCLFIMTAQHSYMCDLYGYKPKGDKCTCGLDRIQKTAQTLLEAIANDT